VTDTAPRDLADRFQQRWLERNPFAATMYGIPGYDHLLPDESEAGEQAWRAEAGRFGAEADAITAATPAEAVTLGCVRGAAAHEQENGRLQPTVRIEQETPEPVAVARVADEFGIRWVRRPFDLPLTAARDRSKPGHADDWCCGAKRNIAAAKQS